MFGFFISPVGLTEQLLSDFYVCELPLDNHYVNVPYSLLNRASYL